MTPSAKPLLQSSEPSHSGVPVRGPDFFIVGAPKCGTSSLHQYLRQHPDLHLPEHKDIPFFGSDLQHSIGNAPSSPEEYLSWFGAAPAHARIGDSCTLYMQSRRAAGEIAAWCPDAAIIVMLRDPVDLMFSLHSHNIWMTEEDILDFDEAVRAEADRSRGVRIPKQCRFPQGLLYRDVAALGDQLERYLDIFSPERVHLIVFDDLRRDLRGVVRDTLRFLGVSVNAHLDLSQTVNSRRAPRSLRVQTFLQEPPAVLERAFKMVTPSAWHGRLLPFLNGYNQTKKTHQTMSSDLRRQLNRELRPQVDKLEALTGLDLPNWCRREDA